MNICCERSHQCRAAQGDLGSHNEVAREFGAGMVLGKTPLLINQAECNNSRLLVEMNMADYLKAIEPLPEMQDWIKRFKSDQYFSAGSYSPTFQRYFSFETSESQQTSSASGGLVSIGPVYNFAEIGRAHV